MMGHFRQIPKGLGRNLGENTRRSMVPVHLDDMAESGNRAQRRWAKRKLQQVRRTDPRQKNGGGHA